MKDRGVVDRDGRENRSRGRRNHSQNILHEKKYFNKRKTLEIIIKKWDTEKERRRKVPLLKTTFISSPVLAPDSFTNPHIYLSFLFDNPATEPLKQTLSTVLGLSLKVTGEKSHEGGGHIFWFQDFSSYWMLSSFFNSRQLPAICVQEPWWHKPCRDVTLTLPSFFLLASEAHIASVKCSAARWPVLAMAGASSDWVLLCILYPSPLSSIFSCIFMPISLRVSSYF